MRGEKMELETPKTEIPEVKEEEKIVESVETQAQTQVPFRVEVVKVLKKWNISEGAIKGVIKYYLMDYNNKYNTNKYVSLYSHETWGSCREWKHVVMNEDGSYLEGGEWIDNSSRKNAHKWKIMEVQSFLEKYAGKNLLIYVHESPSCNKSREFSFKAIFRVVRG